MISLSLPFYNLWLYLDYQSKCKFLYRLAPTTHCAQQKNLIFQTDLHVDEGFPPPVRICTWMQIQAERVREGAGAFGGGGRCFTM